jgi:hypothetical protein
MSLHQCQQFSQKWMGCQNHKHKFLGEFHRDGLSDGVGVFSQRLTGRWVDSFEFVSSRSWGSE